MTYNISMRDDPPVCKECEALLEERDAARSEVERLKQEQPLRQHPTQISGTCPECGCTIKITLEYDESAEVEALRQDALRYRWLRDKHEYNAAASNIVQEVSGEGWDAAIDAALAGEKRNGL